MGEFSPEDVLPSDAETAHLVGRIWDPESGGPRVVSIRDNDVFDLTDLVGTMSELLESEDPVAVAFGSTVRPRWNLAEILNASLRQDATSARLLAPVDLQVLKACGVTFAESLVERVIEERCRGDFERAAEVRELAATALGGSLASVRPGSREAAQAKDVLSAQGMWSQYLEVGIGPDPEVFTKGPVLSSVGFGSSVGIPSFSSWNNPEPELVLVADSSGRARGATLGNDVNLRDVEGRSALLLGMAKDNNASAALGPFIRLFDPDFTLDTLRREEIGLNVSGLDGYSLSGHNNIGLISRSFEELISAVHGRHHQYPDGFVLFTGTLFAPVQDRNMPGQGFTHKPGDVVTISSPHLGTLTNPTGIAEELAPWDFGIRALHAYLVKHRSAAASKQ